MKMRELDDRDEQGSRPGSAAAEPAGAVLT